MTFEVLDNRNNTDLDKGYFATLAAIKGTQFKREVYSSVIKFKDLADFLQIFPNVQRDIIPRKVASIRRYILTGLDKEDVNLRFFSGITATCKGHMFYDEVNRRLAIDTATSKLSINDGMHRFEAIRTAIEQLESNLVKSKDKEKTSKLTNLIDELSEMVIPIIIFNGLSEKEESQLFYDLNGLAQRPSRNANIRLNQTDLVSKMARELAESNRYLKHHGIEYDKMSIQKSNSNSILLTTVYASIKEILDYEYKSDKNFLSESNYEFYKRFINETFDKLFFVLPPDLNTKEKYLIERSYTLKAISRFICHARNHLDLRLSDDRVFDIIKNVDWTYNIEQWNQYGGISASNGNIVFGGGQSGGFKAVYQILLDEATYHDGSLKRVRGKGLINIKEQ